jgi:hypothetical protein
MSLKSREKKRQARLAQSNGRREQRASYTDRHYLTIVSRAACCNRLAPPVHRCSALRKNGATDHRSTST